MLDIDSGLPEKDQIHTAKHARSKPLVQFSSLQFTSVHFTSVQFRPIQLSSDYFHTVQQTGIERRLNNTKTHNNQPLQSLQNSERPHIKNERTLAKYQSSARNQQKRTTIRQSQP